MVTWATRNPLEIRLVESWTLFALISHGLNEIGRVSYLRCGGSLSNDSVIGKRGNSVRETWNHGTKDRNGSETKNSARRLARKEFRFGSMEIREIKARESGGKRAEKREGGWKRSNRLPARY